MYKSNLFIARNIDFSFLVSLIFICCNRSILNWIDPRQ